MNITNVVGLLGTLEPGDRCSWEGEQIVITKPTFWDKIDKFIRLVTCVPAKNEEPFRLSQLTLQNIASFIQAHGDQVPPSRMEDLRCLKLYIANPEWACPLVAQTIKKINQSLVRFHRPGSLPADVLQKIASYDATANTFRAMRQVSVSSFNALHPHALTTTPFFNEACAGSRRHIAQLVHFLLNLDRNQQDSRDDFLSKFLNQATPKAQQLFWAYVVNFTHYLEPITRLLHSSQDKVRSLYFRPSALHFKNLSHLGVKFEQLHHVKHPEKVEHLLVVGDPIPILKEVEWSIVFDGKRIKIAPLWPIAQFVNLRELDTRVIAFSEADIASLGTLRSLEKLTITHPLEPKAIESFPELKELTQLTICLKQSTAKEICELARTKLGNLQQLSVLSTMPIGFIVLLQPEMALSVPDAIEILRRCPQLVAIEIGQNELSVGQAECLQQALVAAPNLEHLALNCRGPGVATLWPTLFHLPKLRSLALYTTETLPLLAPDSLESALEKLIVSCPSDSPVIDTASKLKNLCHLELQGPLHENDIGKIANCKKLQSIHFMKKWLLDLDALFAHELNNQNIAKLASMPTLRQIHLEAKGSVTAVGALHVLRSNPHLQQISGFSEDQIATIPQALHLTRGEHFALSQLRDIV